MGPGDSKGRAATICLSLAAGEEVLGQDSRTELVLPLAYWVAMEKSLSLSGTLCPVEKDRAGLDPFYHPFWFLDGF